MRYILLIAIIFSFFFCVGQGDMARIVVPTTNGQDSALLHLPNDFNTTTGTYPLLVFCHGDGEAGNNLSKIYTSATSGGPAYVIAQNKFPSSFINPKDSKQYKFVVCAPQQSSWSIPAKDLDVAIQFLVSKYRIDPTRIYVTGLSAGGESCEQYAGHYQFIPKYKEAAGVTLSTATDQSLFPSIATAIKADGAHWFSYGDTKDDVHGSASQLLIQDIGSTLGTFFDYLCSSNSGHGCWNVYYDPSFLINGVNMYQWMLQFTSGGITTPPPVVVPPVIIPPVTTPPTTTPWNGICGPGKKYLLAANTDSAVWQKAGSFAFNYQPGDTIVVPHNPNSLGYWAWVTFQGLNGASGCPIVITGDNVAQTLIRGQVQIDGCSNLKFTGSNLKTSKYGIKVEWDPQLRPQEKSGIIIFDRSKNIEIEYVDIHNAGTGIACLTDNNCDQTLDYPNWILDSMVIHDSRITGVWNEGMYWGNTSPDNANYDWRADQCDVAQPGTTYSLPMKNGYTHIYNMIIDSTGRGGIQLGNVGGTNAVSEVNNNLITHSGLSQDDAQGTAISIGLYTKAYIHDNTIRNTYTWGIASLGGCSTNVPIRIENNHIDSSGYLRGYPQLDTTSREVYDPRTEQQADDLISWAYAIEVDTKPRIYTQASGGTAQAPPGAPYGTAVKGQDSTQFQILNNVIGLFKGGALGGTQPQAIQIHDDHPGIQKSGNSICGNTSSIGGTISVLTDGSAINYSTCGVVVPPPVKTPPTVSAGGNQTITIPPTSVPLTGTASGNGGATINAYLWSQLSGPNTSTIANATQKAAIASGLISGTYVFQLKVTDSNGLTATSQVTISTLTAPKTIKSIIITYNDGTTLTLP